MFNFPKKALFISPHPDDSELGCGATISSLRDLDIEVHLIVLSNCALSLPNNSKDTLTSECLSATKRLNIDSKNVKFFDFPVRSFNSHRQELLELLVSIRKDIQPEIVFSPSKFDIHQDHTVVYEESRRAFHRYASHLGYELPWNSPSFEANFFIPVSEDKLNQKCKALQCYQSQIQIQRPYFNQDNISSIARYRGTQCGAKFAEAFHTVNMIAKLD